MLSNFKFRGLLKFGYQDCFIRFAVCSHHLSIYTVYVCKEGDDLYLVLQYQLTLFMVRMRQALNLFLGQTR